LIQRDSILLSGVTQAVILRIRRSVLLQQS